METKTRKTFLGLLASELVLGLLVAVLSVLTAAAAYQSSLSDSQEGDYNVEGQKQLTDSNSLFLEANQFVIYDYTMYDGWYINENRDEELAQYYQDSFSEELMASMDRPEGPFDDPYYDAMYNEAEVKYDEAIQNFEMAQAAGNKANKLQLVVLIFAVGLALAAYASMVSAENKVRYVFSIGSIFALVFGLINYFSA